MGKNTMSMEEMQARIEQLEKQYAAVVKMFEHLSATSAKQFQEVYKAINPDYEKAITFMASLSPLQAAICQLVVTGMESHKIACRLGVSKQTVYNLTTRLRKRLGVDDKLSMVMTILKYHRLVDPMLYLEQTKIPFDWAKNYLDVPIEADPYSELYRSLTHETDQHDDEV